MKLFAVIYSVGGFSREDATNPEIAGVFTDQNIADTVRKAVGSSAKVVSITLDEVSPGYMNFAKNVLNVDIAKIMQEKEDGMKVMSKLDLECRMNASEFIEDADNGYLMSDDGSGYWATETMRSNISCWSERPQWATHVCWYNR